MKEYRENGFPITIVRPSLTYGDTQIVLAINDWQRSYTAVDRMRRGKKVIVPGDGSSLWVVTHNSDFAKGFVGLLGHRQAIGHAFQITSDEVLT
jgi:nucleoside-diphosphate-sugar epimerase